MTTLAGVCRLKKCSRGEAIWLSGNEVGFFGLVGDGFVKMVQSVPGGSEMTMEISGPGQIFGLLGLVAGSGCPLMAYGLTDTVYLRVPKADFLPIYENNTNFKDRLIRRTALRLHQKVDFMGKLFSGRAEERLAAILFILSESYGQIEGKSIRLTLPLTRQALGEMAGTTTETTIRVLSKWAKLKLVVTEQHHIVIVDPDVLATKLR
jgi:CRP/FNR family transcriptional regulator